MGVCKSDERSSNFWGARVEALAPKKVVDSKWQWLPENTLGTPLVSLHEWLWDDIKVLEADWVTHFPSEPQWFIRGWVPEGEAGHLCMHLNGYQTSA